MVGAKAAPLGEDLDFIQGKWAGKVGNGSVSVVLIFSTRGLAKAFEKMESLYHQWSPTGVQFVAISKESKERVATFVEGKKLTLPVAVDPEVGGDSTYSKYPVARLPTVFLCGGDGVITWHGHPLDADLEINLTKAVAGGKTDRAAKSAAESPCPMPLVPWMA